MVLERNKENDKNINCCVEQMKLSVIIPVYNVEQWIKRCLESVYCQNLDEKDFEVLIVNDGTKDNSIEIVENFASVTSNIRIIHQKNQGLSAARNTGLANAVGEYVWFLDSDDCIEPNSLKFLLKHAIEHRLDVLCFGLNLMHDDGRKEQFDIPFVEGVMNGSSFISRVAMPPAAWCALYRRNFLIENKLEFMVGVLHEDQEFTPRAYYLANRIEYIPTVVYNYAQRDGSIMKSDKNARKKAVDLLKICDSLYDFVQKNVDTKEFAYCSMMNKISFAFSQSLRNYSKDCFPLKKYKDKPYYPLLLNAFLSKNEKIKYRIANFSLPLYLFLYKLTKK